MTFRSWRCSLPKLRMISQEAKIRVRALCSSVISWIVLAILTLMGLSCTAFAFGRKALGVVLFVLAVAILVLALDEGHPPSDPEDVN